MTDQIASITLRADVSDLKTASNELDKLGQAAAGAVGDLRGQLGLGLGHQRGGHVAVGVIGVARGLGG